MGMRSRMALRVLAALAAVLCALSAFAQAPPPPEQHTGDLSTSAGKFPLYVTAEYLGMVMRSTGRVRRGLGTIRQDLNISIRGGRTMLRSRAGRNQKD